MIRITDPSIMMLHAYERSDLYGDERLERALDFVREFTPEWPRPEVPAPPVMLRWVTNPAYGFPVRPFQVFRRRAERERKRPIRLVEGRVVVDGFKDIAWGMQVYEVSFRVAISSGSLSVMALDMSGNVIPGLAGIYAAVTGGNFQGIGIGGLRVIGSGVLENITGITADAQIQLPDWELVEVVGLPVREGDTNSEYDSHERQGVVPPALEGYTAAQARLTVAELLAEQPHASGDPSFPAPGWNHPDAETYLKWLSGASPGLMEMIRECVNNCDNGIPGSHQVEYVVSLATKGVQQRNMPGSSPSEDDTHLDLPVVPITLLSAAAESFAATGLGYGTVDFPSVLYGSGGPNFSSLAEYEYMVVGQFKTVWGDVEVCAPAVPAPIQAMPDTLKSETVFRNRPAELDDSITETIRLTWRLPDEDQGYVVAASRKPGHVEVLNTAHPGGWFQPVLAQRPETQASVNPPGDYTTFIDHDVPVSFTGTTHSRYLVCGLDEFGRWTPWRQVSYTSPPPPVQKPSIHQVSFILEGAADPELQDPVPYTIEIEFSWNQEDRRVHAIDFMSHFFPITSSVKSDEGEPNTGSTFQLSSGGPGGAPLRLLFDQDGVPRLPASSPYQIDMPVQAVASNPPTPHILKYRLRIRQAGVHFGNAVKLGYAVYAVAREKVREPDPFGEQAVSVPSEPVRAVTTTIVDPRPPQTPKLESSIEWTALPDATGKARGVLKWDPVPKAKGYAVWHATESALLHAINPTIPEPAPGTSLVTRGDTLRDLVQANETKVLRVFSRINTELIPATRLEIELPGTANTLYAYRVQAVGENNESSERSDGVIVFGVPQVNKPGQPQLITRAGVEGVYIICLSGAGAVTAGFKLFRTRDSSLFIDAGAAGDPKYTPASAAWHPLDDLPKTSEWNPVRAAIASLPQPVHGFALCDPVARSWHPYYYAAVAMGKDEANEGLYQGESVPSASQTVSFTPKQPPELNIVQAYETADGDWRYSFDTDLPIRETPLGTAVIAVYEIKVKDGRIVREKKIESATDQITSNAFQMTEMPELRREHSPGVKLKTYEFRMKEKADALVFVVADPLGRTVEAIWTYSANQEEGEAQAW